MLVKSFGKKGKVPMILADFPNIEGLINHPVHITGNMISSAFIPFCSFGLSMGIFGEELTDFHVPVCRLFREKIVNCPNILLTEIRISKVIEKKGHYGRCYFKEKTKGNTFTMWK